MNKGRLDGKIAIVTGSTSGIGEATARLFAKEGASVVVLGRREIKGLKIAEEICQSGGNAIFIATDMTQENQIKAMIERTIETYGQIDILVNNAGTGMDKRLIDMTAQDWDYLMTLDGKSYFLSMKYALPYMIKRQKGNIVNVSSLAAIQAVPGLSLYGFIKAGIIQMTKSLAKEYAADGIRINAICPGLTRTELVQGLSESVEKLAAAGIPMGRMGTAEEQANAILFLVSDESTFITGANLVVDGGVIS